MEIGLKNISHTIGDVTFTYKELDEEQFFAFYDNAKVEDKVKMAKAALVDVSGATLDGKEMTVEQFKSTKLSSQVMMMLVRALDSAMSSALTGASDSEKNGE